MMEFSGLVEVIINELTNINISLTSPLLKTKVLAKRIQNQELLQWTNYEIIGYKNLDILPEYRKTTGDVYADYFQRRPEGLLQATNQYVNITGDQELFSICLAQGVQTLETYKSPDIAETFEGEQKAVIVAHLCSQNPGIQISRIYKKTPANIVVDALAVIRNKLLDFMLEMEEKYNYVADIKELRSQNSSITQIMHNTITNLGDGVLINTGEGAKIGSIIEVNKEPV
jgi:hypothetical protein